MIGSVSQTVLVFCNYRVIKEQKTKVRLFESETRPRKIPHSAKRDQGP